MLKVRIYDNKNKIILISIFKPILTRNCVIFTKTTLQIEIFFIFVALHLWHYIYIRSFLYYFLSFFFVNQEGPFGKQTTFLYKTRTTMCL